MQFFQRGAVLALFTLGIAAHATAIDFFGVTTTNDLIRFDSSTPGSVQSSVQISGIQAGESIVGIDVRPNNGELFALGSSSRLYRIDASTGAARQIGAVFSTALSGSSFGFDFNPTVDRIRVTSNAGQNLRLNPDTGAVAAVDGVLTYAAGDQNAGSTPNIVASAYTNSFGGSTSTTLFNIDANGGRLVTQVPPNNGTLNTVGSLGLSISSVSGFDIVSQNGGNAGFAALQVSGQNPVGFYTIDLSNGNAALVGNFDRTVTSIAAVPEPGTLAVVGLGALALLRRRRSKS